MPTANTDLYTDYFRQLAVKHTAILHNVDAEQGKGNIKRNRFGRFTAEEFASGQRASFDTPALLITMFDIKTNSESVFDIRQRPSGSFMVIDTAEIGNADSEQAAYARTEIIVYQLLQRIWMDHYGPGTDRCTTPFKQFRLNLDITPTGQLFTSEYGWFVPFDFEFQDTINIAQAPEDGVFID
jgi:hypothetical protein